MPKEKGCFIAYKRIYQYKNGKYHGNVYKTEHIRLQWDEKGHTIDRKDSEFDLTNNELEMLIKRQYAR